MATNRRGQGEGSIYWVEGRQRFAAQSPPDPVTNKRKYIYGKTRREVSEKLKVVLRDQQQGIPVAVERQTVAQCLDRWLADTARHTLAASTYIAYCGNVRLHVVPHIGKVPLAKLTPQQLS